MKELIFHDTVERALKEDIGRGDITTDSVIPANHNATAIILAKEEGLLAGINIAKMTFKLLDKDINLASNIEDGDRFHPGDEIAQIRGDLRAILTAERVALNFLQRMSGIATYTKNIVEIVKSFDVKAVDTRKTTPGLRSLEKYAVRVGGGWNHRFGLDDAVLLKDNHIAHVGSIEEAVSRARKSFGHMRIIEVETTNLKEVGEALKASVDVILLDNMDATQMRKAVDMIDGQATVEASGGITLDNISKAAATGVDVISLGSLTHSAPSLDISLDLNTDTNN